MKKITGNLFIECEHPSDAMVIIADFTGRMRSLGWNVDDIQVTLQSSKES